MRLKVLELKGYGLQIHAIGLELTVDTTFAALGIVAAVVTAPVTAPTLGATLAAGAASLVYSIGKLLYEYSTGQTLFKKP